jgi:hypothetical protein
MKFSYSVPALELQKLMVINYLSGLEDSGAIRNPRIRSGRGAFYAEFELVDITRAQTINDSMRARYNANREKPGKLP